MKRTLLEILSGLAVLVLLASFHHQMTRLESRNDEVVALRGLVQETAAKASSRDEILGIEQRLTGLVDDRLGKLERQVAAATEDVKEAAYLKEQLDAARREAALLKAEIARDVSRTRELVDSYHDELRAQGRSAMATISENKNALQRLNGRVLPNPSLLTREMLEPTVQLNGEDTVGSGTLVHSRRDPKSGRVESYVLTSYHVVRNILADSPRAKHDGIAVTIYRGKDRLDVRASVVSHDESIDIALLKVKSDQVFDNVARLLPRDQGDLVKVWDDVYAIGCPLGNDPIPTRGSISSKHNELNGTNYWMINAPTYYGNSGGGVFLADSRDLIGVFSKIYTHGRGNPVVIPHMGLCTPITAIYAWLEREKLDHLLPGDGETAPAEPELDLAAPVK